MAFEAAATVLRADADDPTPVLGYLLESKSRSRPSEGRPRPLGASRLVDWHGACSVSYAPCVSDAMAAGKPVARKQKIDELMAVFARYGCMGGQASG
jgi:hypothetical protein